MLGPRLLLQPGFLPGLVALISPRRLTTLAAWQRCLSLEEEGQKDEEGPNSQARQPALAVLVAGILHEAMLHAQSSALRDIHQVQWLAAIPCPYHPLTVILGCQRGPADSWQCWQCPDARSMPLPGSRFRVAAQRKADATL
jgi:hypothetical protein